MLTRSAQLRLIRMAQKKLDKEKDAYNFDGTCGGSFNNFVRLTENFAIKIRHSSHKSYNKDVIARENVELFERACNAYAVGCGPYTFGLFYHAHFGICFLVEIVRIAKNEYKYVYQDDIAKEKAEVSKPIRHLVRKMFVKIGFNFVDYHLANIGINNKGEFICIDFDAFEPGFKSAYDFINVDPKGYVKTPFRLK